MTTDRKALETLDLAIQTEQDARECYEGASRASRNELGKRLLDSLAAEAGEHQRRFQQIRKSLEKNAAWPAAKLTADSANTLREDFEKTCEVIGVDIKSVPEELDAIERALQKKDRTYDLYSRQAKAAKIEAERELFKTLAAEERAHYLVLVDYYDYLKDPGAYFTKKEKPSLDGG